MMGSTFGRCTLIATSWPVSRNTALYTCQAQMYQSYRDWAIVEAQASATCV